MGGLGCGRIRADIPDCRFAAFSSAAFMRGTGDWKVARTGRLESLPYMKVVY